MMKNQFQMKSTTQKRLNSDVNTVVVAQARNKQVLDSNLGRHSA